MVHLTGVYISDHASRPPITVSNFSCYTIQRWTSSESCSGDPDSVSTIVDIAGNHVIGSCESDGHGGSVKYIAEVGPYSSQAEALAACPDIECCPVQADGEDWFESQEDCIAYSLETIEASCASGECCNTGEMCTMEYAGCREKWGGWVPYYTPLDGADCHANVFDIYDTERCVCYEVTFSGGTGCFAQANDTFTVTWNGTNWTHGTFGGSMRPDVYVELQGGCGGEPFVRMLHIYCYCDSEGFCIADYALDCSSGAIVGSYTNTGGACYMGGSGTAPTSCVVARGEYCQEGAVD